jgi:hypothetical protein
MAEKIESAQPLPETEKTVEQEQTVTKKPRKEFVWTEKRLEAFNKMREGLATKVEISKQLKEEKKIQEKEEIKKRVKAIMEKTALQSSEPKEAEQKKKKAKSKEIKESSASEEEVEFSTSEEEVKKPVKKQKEESKKDKKSRKQKPKRKQIVEEVSEDSDSSEDASSSDSENEMDFVHNQRQGSYSHKQLKNHSRDKINGKSARRAQFVNPMDRFILL